MRFTLRLTARHFVAFALLASGCRTLSLQIDEPRDVSSYRTWDFVHTVGDAIHVPLNAGIDFESIVAKQVETGLTDRGFLRTPNDPDLLVYFQLVVREQLVQENVTGAIEHLPSLHYAPSYEV